MIKCAYHLCEKEAKVKFCSPRCKNNYYVTKNRKNLKKKAAEFLGGKCKICGYDKCFSALSFHHRDPSKKSFKIGYTNMSWTKTLKEVKKCDLLCANCHAEVHEKLSSWYSKD